MGKLYKIKLIHTLTGLICATIFLLSTHHIQDLFVKPSNFLHGFVLYLPVAGAFIALLFCVFKNTFTLPVLLSIAAGSQVVLSEPGRPIAFMLPFIVLFIPYARYFYKYRDFEELLSILRWLIPSALLFSWFVTFPQSQLIGFDFRILAVTVGAVLLFVSCFKNFRLFAFFTLGALILSAGVQFFMRGFTEVALFQFYLFIAGVLAFNYGKTHVLHKETLLKISRARAILLPVILSVIFLALVDFQEFNMYDLISEKSRAISKIFVNRAGV